MIWVVDDNSAVAESLAALLIASGFKAMAMTSGRLALERLRAGEQPALMVLDLRMPGNGGNDVLEQIAFHPEWTFPVIVSTGCEELLSDALVSRVAAVLPKTVDPMVMIAHIRGALTTAS